MGIRFTSHSKSWRAPLQLIDSWLPVRPCRPAPQTPTSPAVKAFARAGWLKGATSPPLAGGSSATSHPQAQRGQHLQLVRTPASLGPSDTRLVISGRIGEVCAELDRLAALERMGSLRSA